MRFFLIDLQRQKENRLLALFCNLFEFSISSFLSYQIEIEDHFANNISLLKQSINLDSRKILKFEILNADRDILLKTASIGKLLTKRR